MEESRGFIPMVLSCGGSSSRVTGFAFAAFGVGVTGHCGDFRLDIDDETVKAVDVSSTEAVQTCIGTPGGCELNISAAALGIDDPAPGVTKKLTVQWTCALDINDAIAGVETSWPLPLLPLRTSGADIVDAAGARIRLAAVNWAGGENDRFIVGGLDVSPLGLIAKSIASMGFNAVRIPFSTALVRDNPIITNMSVGANPDLSGLRALEVMDAVVTALSKERILVVLDNHMTDGDWCCQRADCNGVVFASEQKEWLAVLSAVATRYSTFPTVIGIELRNEPREVCPGLSWHVGPRMCKPDAFISPWSIASSAAAAPQTFGSRVAAVEAAHDGYDVLPCAWPQWDKGPSELRHKPMMERGGAAVLKANPNLLVVVDALYYGRDLTEADGRGLIQLPVKDRLVYAVHDYSWYVTSEESVSYASWAAARTAAWGRLVAGGAGPPVWVSEFGVNHWTDFRARGGGGDSGGASGGRSGGYGGEPLWWRWFSKFAGPRGGLKAGGLDFAYWQLGGQQVGGTSRRAGAEESYGLMNQCWTAPANAEHLEAIRMLLGAQPE